ncbi:MAG: hypothetical protein AB7F43_07015 [Bacteriovoracia bacterium]
MIQKEIDYFLEKIPTETLVEALAVKMQTDLRRKSGGEMKFGHFRIYIHEGALSKVEAWPRDVLIRGTPLKRRSGAA